MTTPIASLEVRNLLAFGNIVISDGKAPDAIAPRLDWRDRSDVVVDGEPDLFAALQWRYGMAPTLQGRATELQSILDWADDGKNSISVRLLSGGGGSGKTRLAAEAAAELRSRGWSAGFVPRGASQSQTIDTSMRKFLLVFDYPEERMEVVRGLIEAIRDISDTLVDFPIRILLVSRRVWADWEHELAALGPRAGRQELSVLSDLKQEQAQKLFDETAQNFSELIGKPHPDLSQSGQWLEKDAHRVPLVVMAAAIHHVLTGNSGFDLGASELFIALAKAERIRAQRISMNLGLGEDGIPRLMALAALTDDGLTDAQCETLGQSQAVPMSGQLLIDALKKSPWRQRAKGGGSYHLVRPEPDRMAATFLAQVLLEDPSDRLPDWLATVSVEQSEAFGDVISRVGYDLLEMPPQWFNRFEQSLVGMLVRDPDRISAFVEMAHQKATVFSAGFSVAVLQRLLALDGLETNTRAGTLNNLAAMLSYLGQREEALEAAREAVALYRALVEACPEAFTPDLAMSLNNLANMLSDLGQREEALEAAREAVALRRVLAEARPAAFTPDLATSLNNLANMLSDLGQREEALEAAGEAVELITPFFLQNPGGLGNNAMIMLRGYIERCQALDKEPDIELLGPSLQLIAHFQEQSVG